MSNMDNAWGDIHSLTNLHLEDDEVNLQQIVVPSERFGGGINFDEYYISYTDSGAFIYEVVEFTEADDIMVERIGKAI